MVSRKKKAKKKRDNKKFPGLTANLYSKIKQQYFDYDYIEKLSDEEKEWLSNFTEEYLGARLNHKGKKLHKTKRLKKDCYDRNNQRQRDIYNIKKVTGHLGMEDELVVPETGDNVEDYLIDLIDNDRKPTEEAEFLKDDSGTEDPTDNS